MVLKGQEWKGFCHVLVPIAVQLLQGYDDDYLKVPVESLQAVTVFYKMLLLWERGRLEQLERPPVLANPLGTLHHAG